MSEGERRPLLADTEVQREIPGPTPLPKVQLGILCLLRTLDPMSFSQIFPYINQLIGDLQVTDDPSQVGLYSGLVESAYAASQLLSIYPWGLFSDRFGRRPVVLTGVAGLAITTLLFGLSWNFSTAMLFRGLAGLFSGNVVVIPSILCEITDESNQGFAFPFFGIWWPVGAVIGPLIGGLFSEPAQRYPNWFNHEFFRSYPYFLPGFMVSIIALIALVLSWFFLIETHTRSKKVSRLDRSLEDPGPVAAVSESYDASRLLSLPIIRALCISALALSFISTAFDVLFVLFCYSPIDQGGLAFSTSRIGFALASSGTVAAFLQVFFMPTMLRRFNHAVMYHFCMKIWPFTFLSLPCLNLVARRGVLEGSNRVDSPTTWMLWTGIVLVLCMARVAFLCYSVNMLLVKRYAPNSSSLGSTTGLLQFSIYFSRAFSPAISSSIFAFSSSKDGIAGYSWVLVMAFLGFIGSLFSAKIVQESQRLRVAPAVHRD